MPSTNKKGPINKPPGIDSKNPAKFKGLANFDFGELMKDPLGLGSLNKVVNSTDYRGHLTSDAVSHGFTDNFGKLDTGNLDANKVTASGGDSGGDNNNLISTINNQEKPTSLYGSGRFNKLWSLYNKVKGVEGIENDPRYHKLIKKISRKMPRTLRNLKTKMDKSTEMRQKISDELGNNITVTSSQENYNAAIARGNQFLKDPFHKPIVRNSEEKNKEKVIGEKQVVQKYSAGKNLGSRLGTDISAALKNKKW